MKKRLFATMMIPVMMCSTMAMTGMTAASETTDSVNGVTFPLEEPLTLDVFVYASNSGGNTMQDNYVTDWIEEQTNIHLNFVYDVDGDEAKTKLNLIMTDPDSLPDILWTTFWTKSELMLYAEQGLIQPLDDYLEDATNWNAYNELIEGRKEDLTMKDGHIYTFGSAAESFHNTYQNRMWIYMPWVEQLNDGHIPETTKELYEYLTKVATEDPNGNGIADEIPVTGYLGGWSTDPTVWFMNAFVQCNNPLSNTNPTVGAGFSVNDGVLEYAPLKEEYREGIRYLAKLYREGLIDQQLFTQDSTQFAATLNNETPLVAMHAAGRNQADKTDFDARRDGTWSDWQCIEPVEGPDGVRLAAREYMGQFGNCTGMITTNCECPEIVVALFDFLLSHDATLTQGYGPQGYGWDYVDSGVGVNGEPASYTTYAFKAEEFDWTGNGFSKSYDKSSWSSDACISGFDTEFKSSILVEDPAKNLEYILYHAAKTYEQYAPSIDSILPNLTMDTESAQKVSEYTVTIGGYVNQAAVQFITGAMDIETEWDSYLNSLQNMGVEDYIATYQQAYDLQSAATAE